MRTQCSWAVAAVFALATVSHAQPSTPTAKSQTARASASDDSSRLPVKRVVLYKNGVGYGKWTHIDGWSESIIEYIRALAQTAWLN